MKLLRLLVISCLLILPGSISFAADKTGPGSKSEPVTVYKGKFPISIPAGEYELISSIIDAAPGAGVATHKHGGPVLVVVLAGEVTLREKGVEVIKKAGESWTENSGNEHSVVNAGKVVARVAVTMLLPKGAEATTVIEK